MGRSVQERGRVSGLSYLAEVTLKKSNTTEGEERKVSGTLKENNHPRSRQTGTTAKTVNKQKARNLHIQREKEKTQYFLKNLKCKVKSSSGNSNS